MRLRFWIKIAVIFIACAGTNKTLYSDITKLSVPIIPGLRQLSFQRAPIIL